MLLLLLSDLTNYYECLVLFLLAHLTDFIDFFSVETGVTDLLPSKSGSEESKETADWSDGPVVEWSVGVDFSVHVDSSDGHLEGSGKHVCWFLSF